MKGKNVIDKENWIKLHHRYLDVFMKMCLTDIRKVYPRLVIKAESCESFTDGDNTVIQIGIQNMNYEKEEDLMLNVLFVLGHEIQHVRSTSKKAWEYGMSVGYISIVNEIYKVEGGSKRFLKSREDCDDYLKELQETKDIYISPKALTQYVHFIINSLEDGRIERIRSNFRQDFKNQRTIVRGKTWMKTKVEKEEVENIEEPVTFLCVILNEILSLSTARVFMQNFEQAAEKSPELHKKMQMLKPFIKKGVMSANCRGCMESGIEIIKLIALELIEACKSTPLEKLLSKMADIMPSEDETFTGRSDQEETGEGDAGGSPLGMDALEDADNENGSGEGTLSGTDEDDSEKRTSEKGNSPDKKEKSTNICGDSIMLGKVNKAIDESRKVVDEDVKLATEARDVTLKTSRMPESQFSQTDELPDITDVAAAYGYDVTFQEKTRDYPIDTQMPIDIAGPAKKLKKKIEKILHNQETPELRSQKSGCLDTHDLAKLAMNQLDIYMKPAQTIEFNGCAYLLMDDSGSMGDFQNSKRWFCISAVAQIEEAFESLMPVKVTAFEAHGSGRVVHHCVKNWHEKTRYNATYNFFSHVPIGNGNKDGYSIRVATKEILAQSEKKKILIVLSDGLPSDYRSNNEAYSDVFNAVNTARKSGIEVISIYFGADLKEDARDVKLFRQMYGDRFSLISKPEDLGDELTKIMKRFSFKR